MPLEAGEVQKSDETANDDFESPTAGGDATDDDTTPEPPAARRAFFPSSIGLSLLVSKPDPSAPGRSELGRLPGRAPGRPGERRRESCPRGEWAKVLPSLTPKRREMAEVLLDQRAATTANRIVASAPLTRPIWMCLMYWMNRPYQEDRRRSYY